MKSCPGIKRVFGLLAGLLLSFSLCPLPVLADVLEIPGTGACEVLLRAVADAFNREHTEHRVIVPPSIGTVGGMRLITGDQAVLRALWAFVRTYFLRAGFLDGREGFMLAVSNAEGTYYRYIKLMLLK